MDCNNYSYAPHMLDSAPAHYTPCNRVTIERRHANGRDYFIILTDTGSSKAYSIDEAIWTAENWIREGV